MRPHYDASGITIYAGDCLEIMPTLEPESVDAIVTDPPYGLKFMGKDWDHGVPGVHFWEAACRVAKPGAHLLAFGGTRTSHRLVCAIEDAGWEIRDTILWVYGSGFPKSLDVSKVIDRLAPRVGMFDAFAVHFAERRRASGLSQKQIATHFPSKTGGLTGCVWNWENGANVPTPEQWAILQPMLSLSDEWTALIDRVEAEREVIGQQDTTTLEVAPGQGRDRPRVELDLTVPATEAAKQWSGWGTALKPAVEPIVLARKPLVGTVAANVQRYGTGALNIDASRIGFANDADEAESKDKNRHADFGSGPMTNAVYGKFSRDRDNYAPSGRWPANLIHDGSEEVLECFPEETRPGHVPRSAASGGIWGNGKTPSLSDVSNNGFGDSGTAARFFYCAKASRSDRYSEAGNDHPTVKPEDLMRYLIRLITPPGGLVLDPFLGSGTTSKAAHSLGFRCIGIDLEERHCEIAAKRLTQGVLDFGGAA